MTTKVCMTVDVEDFYDGMAELGEPIARPVEARSGLAGLSSLLEGKGEAVVTLFAVGNYADRVRSDLAALIDQGHEIGCHGPDHGHLPEDPKSLVQWLRRGREMVEDLFQRPVSGFRSPRFDVPRSLRLAQYRDALAEAGFDYVSDRRVLGPGSPVREFPVLARRGFPLGGGSYQRMLPAAAVESVVGTSPEPVVLYYHSYDFGATLPPDGLDPLDRTCQATTGQGPGRRAVLAGCSNDMGVKLVAESPREFESILPPTARPGSPPSTRASRFHASWAGVHSSIGCGSQSTPRWGCRRSESSTSDAAAARCSPHWPARVSR